MNSVPKNTEVNEYFKNNTKKFREESERNLKSNSTNGIPNYIISNLKKFSNCFIQKYKYDLEKISRACGFTVAINRCANTSGYILTKEICRG